MPLTNRFLYVTLLSRELEYSLSLVSRTIVSNVSSGGCGDLLVEGCNTVPAFEECPHLTPTAM